MIKIISKPLQKFLVYSAAIFPVIFINAPDLRACGMGPPPDRYYFFTTKEMMTDFSLKPAAKNSEGCSREKKEKSEFDSNITEWLNYMGLDTENGNSVKELVYGNNIENIKSVLRALKSPSENYKKSAIQKAGKLSKNRGLIKLINDFNIDSLRYLLYAKECEKYARLDYDPWNGPAEPDQKSRVAMETLEKRGLLERNKTRDPSLKTRYAFQIIRLSHYRNDFQKTREYFERMNLKNDSPLYYRILSLYAGALTHVGEKDKARYLFALIASRSEDYSLSAQIDFNKIQQDENGFKKSLEFAKDTDEKIEIYKVRSIISSQMTIEDLDAIRKLNSSSGAFGSVLLHQISLLEENLLNRFLAQKDIYPETPVIYDFNSEENKKFSSWNSEEVRFLKKFRSFISDTLDKYSVCNPGLWNLAAAYLSLLDEDLIQAKKYLSQVKLHLENIDKLFQEKYNELDLMYTLMSNISLDHDNRQLVSGLLSSNYGKKRVEDTWDPYQSQMYIHRALKFWLINQDSRDLSLLISDWEGFNLENYSVDQLSRMLFILEKPEKDSLEEYIIYQSGLTPQHVGSRLISALIKSGQIEEAVALSERITEEPLNKDYIQIESPFENPYSKKDNPDKKSIKWSKKTFARHMLDLQKRAEEEISPVKKAEIYMEMGNGWYNISHFGSWWIIADDSWSAYDKAEKSLNVLKRAKELWEKTANLHIDSKEIKAKALFLSALAQQDINALTESTSYTYNETRSFPESEKKIWKAIRDNYTDTAYFKEVISECSYYLQFVKSN